MKKNVLLLIATITAVIWAVLGHFMLDQLMVLEFSEINTLIDNQDYSFILVMVARALFALFSVLMILFSFLAYKNETKSKKVIAFIFSVLTLNILGSIIIGLFMNANATSEDEKEIENQRSRMKLYSVGSYFFLVIIALFIVIPFYWMVSTSLKSDAELQVTGAPSLYPLEFTLSNYATIFEDTGVWGYMQNTLLISLLSTIGGTILSILTAFALSRLSFKGKEVIFIILLATMMIPGEMMAATNYVTVVRLGWSNPVGRAADYYWGAISAMTIPFLVSIFHVYQLRQNFRQIPNELYYAAKVDGTSDWKYLWTVMVPIASSGIVTITILKMMGAWNSYVWPNLIAARENRLITHWVRSEAARATEGSTFYPVNRQMAATIVVTIPILIIFIVFKKYIMRGVSRSGIKG